MAHFGTPDPCFSPSFRISSIQFLVYTPEEVKRLSCKRITNPLTFDTLLHPTTGGLYDPALGPSDRHELCGTCGLDYIQCPGHLGHISLPLPVFHPIFFTELYQLLQSSCLACHHLLVTRYKAHILKGQMKLLDAGLVSEALDLECHVKNADGAGKEENSDLFLEGNVTEYVEKCTQRAEENGTLSDWRSRPLSEKSRNLTEVRRTLVHGFFRSVSSTKCPRCDAPVRKIRHEHQNRLILRGLSDKQASAWIASARKEKQILEVTMNEDDGRDEEKSFADRKLAAKFCTEQQFFTPLEAREHLRKMWDNSPLLMSAVFSCLKIDSTLYADLETKGHGMEYPVDMFFLDTLLVSPSRFRPISTLGAKKFENSQTSNLQKVLQDCQDIEEVLAEKRKLMEEVKQEEDDEKPKQSLTQRLQFCWSTLQLNVNNYMDSDINKKIKDIPSGIKQILEKKEGLFRKHMMGKRVNYAARSVISPDPNINMDEIGVPMVFATRLTYPEPVTYYNCEELCQAVINGPNVHPGATHVQNEDGSLILLQTRNIYRRKGIAKTLLLQSKRDSVFGGAPKKVYRHIKNGDVLLLNRQPSLHKPSIMAHKARILPGEKTLRLHYANCKTYNADFDGDEMNAHFPQGELARAEAYNIVSTHHQYLVPKDGTPLSGLIQDHVVSGVLLSIRDRFFTWEDYHKLLFIALPNFASCFKLIPPCIYKPQRLWTGKQVISSLLLNLIPDGQDKLNLISKSKISPKEWGRRSQQTKPSNYSDLIMTESEVIFRNGQLMSGVLDKAQFGASQFGFVHSCYELYGGPMCNDLLSALGRIFTGFLQLHGFSLGVEDILVTPKADIERLAIIKEGRGCGPEAAAEAFAVKNIEDKGLIMEKYTDAHHTTEDSGMKLLDFCVKKRTDQINNRINTACVPAGLHKPFPGNSLQLMVQAGAKGSTVNCMQISCLLGQIELEGRRPPIMLSGKSLPSFQFYDTCPRAGGFVDGRFLTGIRPQEYFFHCMAGREGLVDTAVKTSRSGYLQRCLIKHLEGITVQYDQTVRDSDGSIIQFLYGEDSLDITKTRFLVPKQMHFLEDNYQAFLYKLDPGSAVEVLESVMAGKYQRKIDRWKRRNKDHDVLPRPRRSGFLDYYELHLPEMKVRNPNSACCPDFNYRTKAQRDVIDMWHKSSPMLRNEMSSKYERKYLPALTSFRPDRHFGSVPEKLIDEVNKYISQNPRLNTENAQSKNSLLTAEKFKTLANFKCLRALAEPGEPVGLLAAQSIGEPSTQMTLNTFHFAGRGEMNVTLGIPRLREILMTASPNIKTPAMDVPLLPRTDSREQGEILKKLFTRVLLSDVLDQVEVWESLSREGSGFQHRIYHIKMSFLDPKYYQNEYVVTPSMILQFIEEIFVKKLAAAVNKEIKSVTEKKMKTGVVPDREAIPILNQDISDEAIDNPAPQVEDEDDTDVSDVDEEEHGDSSKQKKRKVQQVSYDDDEDQEAYDILMGLNEGTVEKEENNEGMEIVDGDIRPKRSKPRPSDYNKDMDTNRIQAVLSSSSHAVDYIYDSVEERWCQLSMKFGSVECKVMMASLIEKLSEKVVVWEIPHIRKGFLVESQVPGEQGVLRLKTEGVNMQELWKHEDVLDLRKAYTNNIHSIASTFGIEAAGKAIIKEISSVFNVYGISVDHHHLTLIADYMTFDGSYKPFNRFGMESNSSPFQQMSFETTMKFLRSATVQRDVDVLQSPSACLVTGRVVRGGTGIFECLQRLKI